MLEDLEPLFWIFYTFVCNKVPGKVTDKYMENLKQASGEILSSGTPQKYFSTILCFVALVYKSFFFQNSRFTEIRFSYKHCNFSRVCHDGVENRDKVY